MAGDVLKPVDDGLRAVARRLRRGATTATLATLEQSSGWPYASLATVASALDGSALLLLSGLSHHTKALMADPRCSLLVVDPEDTARFVQIRGDAVLVTDGAIEHLDALTRRYTRHLWFYGFVYPKARQALETRVIGRIHARRITLDAIHA